MGAILRHLTARRRERECQVHVHDLTARLSTQALGAAHLPPTHSAMQTFLFIGSVLPETSRISSPQIGVKLEAGPDFPAGDVSVQITDSRVVARFLTDRGLTDIECATLRNVVQDVASSICDSASILEGAWTVVTIDTCLTSDGQLRMRFSNASHRLKLAFQEQGVSASDIASINLHADGFFLRLALDDLNAGLMEPKFMRSHFHRAIESLRNSVLPVAEGLDRAKRWEAFRAALDLDRAQIAVFTNHAERHGDYGVAPPMSAQEVDVTLVGIAEIVTKYVRWFKANKLSPRGASRT